MQLEQRLELEQKNRAAHEEAAAATKAMLESRIAALQGKVSRLTRRLERPWEVAEADVELLETELGRGTFGVVRTARWQAMEVAAKVCA